MRAFIAAVFVIGTTLFGAASDPQKPTKKPAPKPGIKTPGVQIPFQSLKPLAEITIEGAPGDILVNDSVWVLNSGKDSVVKIDGKTNKPADPVKDLHKPCSGLASGFGSLLIPNCGDQT